MIYGAGYHLFLTDLCRRAEHLSHIQSHRDKNYLPSLMVFTQKSSKKRPAPAQGGPKPKKLHVENESSKVNDKKRSRPVTQPLDTRDPDSESEQNDIDVEDELDDHEDEVAMQVDSKTDDHKIPKDPNQKKKVTFIFLQPLTKLKTGTGTTSSSETSCSTTGRSQKSVVTRHTKDHLNSRAPETCQGSHVYNSRKCERYRVQV